MTTVVFGWDGMILFGMGIFIHFLPNTSCAKLLILALARPPSLLWFMALTRTYLERRPLWADLNHTYRLVLSGDPPWCLLGDFNACLPNAYTLGMTEFKDCVTQLGITDLRSIDSRFTSWDSCRLNPTSKKLDMILINDRWMNYFPLSLANFMSKGLSDHCSAAIPMGLPAISMGLPTQKLFPNVSVFNYLTESPNPRDEVSKAGNGTFLVHPYCQS